MTATFSEDRRYRYHLERRLAPGSRRCLFVMLNPSTADEELDDPTIRRCRTFALREDCDILEVVNLYAFRATNPADLRTAKDPVGPENARHIREAALRANLVIAAWGDKHLDGDWPHRVLEILCEAGAVHVLRWTLRGNPGHPLYVPSAASLSPIAGGRL